MAGSLPAVINKGFLTCQICLEPFTQPKILPCLHTFCKACLEPCIRNASQRSTLACPTCRNPTPIPPGGTHEFKTNFFVLSLQDVMTSQNVTDKNCDNCNENMAAMARCLECRDFLCKRCCDAHKLTKVTRNHHSVTIAELQSGRFERELRESLPILCEVHNDPLKLYCVQCDKAICFNCKVTEHDGHRATNLREAATNERDTLAYLLGKVQSRMTTMEQYMHNLSTYKSTFDLQQGALRIVMRDRQQALHSLVDKQTSQLQTEIDHTTQTEDAEINKYTDMIKKHLASLKDAAKFTTEILAHGSDGEIVAMRQELADRMSSLQLIPSKEFVHKQRFDFSLAAQDVSSIRKEQLCGEIHIRNMGSVFAPNVKKGHCIQSFDSKTETDENVCFVSGLAITADNNIVILDQNNYKVKIFNTNGHLVGEFNFADKINSPITLTIMNDGKIAILDESRSIAVFTRTGRFIRKIPCPAKTPAGMAVNHTGQIFISDQRSKSLFILDSDGTVLQTIGQQNNQKHFDKIGCVASSIHGQAIAADLSTHSLRIVDMDGHLVATYGTKGDGQGQLNIPISICTDDYGNIIVADYHNHRVHLLSHDAKFVTYLVERSHGLYRPTALTVNNEGHLLVAKDTGNIKVYQYID